MMSYWDFDKLQRTQGAKASTLRLNVTLANWTAPPEGQARADN
jgi:hypothetical protein